MKAEILQLLSDAPASTGEVAVLIGVPANKGVGATLGAMRKDGLIRGRQIDRIGQGRGPRVTTMWEIAA
jgi:hypothetical protein